MAQYFADFDNEEETFEFDGCPYLFELKYTDEKLLQRSAIQLLQGYKTREIGGIPVAAVTLCPQRKNTYVVKSGTFCCPNIGGLDVSRVETDQPPVWLI